MATQKDSIHQALDRRFASLGDLRAQAKRRLPKFAFDYLQGGIGNEAGLARNRACLDEIILKPKHILQGFEPDLETGFLGRQWAAPFGVAPIGLSGIIWPNAAIHLAAMAERRNIPFGLSTVATTSLETIAATAPASGWFQLYIPNDEAINKSLIERAINAGYQTLIVTTDVPALGRRQRDIKNGLAVPPKISLASIWQSVLHPRWTIETVLAGIPAFENLDQYVPKGSDMRSSASYISALARGHVSMDRLARVREQWPGKLIVKGILSREDARTAKQTGADAIIVSNHGARQLDAAPAPLQVIAEIRKTVGKDFPIIMDSGVESGLDIARLLASGADFVLIGRGFAYSVAALGKNGPDHAFHILASELKNVMSQLGCRTPLDLTGTRFSPD